MWKDVGACIPCALFYFLLFGHWLVVPRLTVGRQKGALSISQHAATSLEVWLDLEVER